MSNLLRAIQAQAIDQVREFLMENNNEPDTLCYAIHIGNIEIIEMLLKAGYDTEPIMWMLESFPIHIAKLVLNHSAINFRPKVESWTLWLPISIAKAISEYSSHNDEKSNTTAFNLLWHAIQKQNLDFVRLILTYGIDVNYIENWSLHHLSHAVCFGNTEMVRLFLEAGADLHPSDSRSPKEIAKGKGYSEIVTLLESYE